MRKKEEKEKKEKLYLLFFSPRFKGWAGPGRRSPYITWAGARPPPF